MGRCAFAPTSNGSFKRNRNDHMKVLVAQVASGVFSEPFDKCPPDGPLKKLPAHLSTPRRRSTRRPPSSRTPASSSSRGVSPTTASRDHIRTPLFASSAASRSPLASPPRRAVSPQKSGRRLSSGDGELVAGLHRAIDDELADRMKVLYSRLEKTSSTLERMGSELESERREHMHLQVQYQEAQVLIKSQQERIDQLETEMSTVKAVSKRERERLLALHKIEMSSCKK